MTPFYAIRKTKYHPRTTAPIELSLLTHAHHHICAKHNILRKIAKSVNDLPVNVGLVYLGKFLFIMILPCFSVIAINYIGPNVLLPMMRFCHNGDERHLQTKQR